MTNNQNNSSVTNQSPPSIQLNEEVHYAWYSEKQRKSTGKTHIYLNADNKEVHTTSVSQENITPNFDDAQFIGKVTKWVRNIEHYDVRN